MNVGNVTVASLPNAHLTVKVRIAKRFMFRMRLGLWLIKLGAWICPLSAKVELE